MPKAQNKRAAKKAAKKVAVVKPAQTEAPVKEAPAPVKEAPAPVKEVKHKAPYATVATKEFVTAWLRSVRADSPTEQEVNDAVKAVAAGKCVNMLSTSGGSVLVIDKTDAVNSQSRRRYQASIGNNASLVDAVINEAARIARGGK